MLNSIVADPHFNSVFIKSETRKIIVKYILQL